MSGKGKERALFDESDSGSVATDSTAESEQLEEYGVERILAEQQDDDGNDVYLIKWEGYPLARSTWEPAGNILDPSILKQWRAEKRRVQRDGKDLTEWQAAVTDEWQEAAETMDRMKRDRMRRRKAKRRRRDIAVSPKSGSEKHDDLVGSNGHGSLFVKKRTLGPEKEPPARTRKRVKQTEIRRKGVAQKVRRRATTDASSSGSEGASSSDDSSGGDSLLEEIASAQKSTQASRAPERPLQITSEPSEESDEEPLAKRKSSGKPQTTVKVTVPTTLNSAEAAEPQAPTSAALATESSSTNPAKTTTDPAPKKLVPPAPAIAASSAPKAKRTGRPDKIFGNWDADKSRRQRPRVSGATPKDSTDPQFPNLSIQHQFQLYSRNERAPDFSALKIIDPKTGKTMPSMNVTEGSGTGNVHSAYGRRSPPPDKPPEPRPSKQVLPEEPVRGGSGEAQIYTAPPTELTAPTQRELTPAEKLKQETCWYWTQKECRYNENTCRRAHRHTGIFAGTKNVTCFYWHEQGWCSRSDAECRFAHFDTDTVAPPPPGYQLSAERKRSMPIAADPGEVAHRGGVQPPPRLQGALPPLETPAQPSASGRGEQSTPRETAREVAAASAPDVSTRETTCYFWKNGGCTKPDGVCKFAHRDTGIYAAQPGSFKKAQADTSLAPNPNLVPVASRENFAPERARGREIPAADRRDGWTQQTVVQTREPDKAPPMHLTDSPVNMAFASPRETVTQLNSLGASMPRRANAPKFSMKATVVFSFQGESQDEKTDVTLHILNDAVFKRFAGSEPILRIEHMVTTSDFEHLLWNDDLRDVESSSGDIFVESIHTSNIDTITDTCKAHVAGLVACPEGYSSKMLIYPANAEEWKFLDQGHRLSSGCVLRFRLFKDLPNPWLAELRLQAAAIDEQPAVQRLGEELITMNAEMFFPTRLGKNVPRATFLMIPQTHQIELAVLIKYFAALDCQVYHPGDPGAWHFFRKTFIKSCAVIVHPDVQLWRIPDLFDFLSTGGARMFSLGVNRAVAMLEERDPEFGCERLFPHGTVMYITDETFLNDPEQANDIIRAFVNSHKSKPFGGENSRIAARPGVMEWLYGLAVANTSERVRRDNRWMKLYSSMCRLARLDLDDEDSDGSEPGSDVPLYLITASPELLPALEDLNGLEDGEVGVAATDVAVDWFAGWSLLHASRFRKFVVCHEPKAGMRDDVTSDETSETDPRGWAKKYQHIGVVPPRVAMQIMRK